MISGFSPRLPRVHLNAAHKFLTDGVPVMPFCFHRPNAAVLLMAACAWTCAPAVAANEDAGAAKVAFFEQRVRPVLSKHCYPCHASTSDDIMGGLTLDSRGGWRRGGDSGPAIVPGDPENSLLMEAISYQNLDLQMPPEGQLAASLRDDIAHWIKDGAVDPRETPQSSRPVADRFDLVSRAAEHWAWRPIKRPTAARNVDAFIDQGLRNADMQAAPRARPETLVRRIHFDLVGLPPTIAQVDRFLVAWARDPDLAVEQHVDLLLATPQFGEHWARHWLDLVRFSETKGHVTDQERPFAWKYRDYVIDAFNQDLPYDRFVLEHLAGDLLPASEGRTGPNGQTNVAPTATGALFMHSMHFMAVDPVKQRWDEIDAQLDMVGKVFLGLTLECARCHDHKFDAIGQRDYYAFAGFFYGTEQGVARTAPRQPVTESDAAEVERLEAKYREYLEEQRAARRAKQSPKVGGKYFPISDELGIQTPQQTRQLMHLMQRLSDLDPSWAQWVRAARDRAGADVPLLVRGNHRNQADPVARRFLQALGGTPLPETERSGSGRIWLARQIANADNPLTSRVWVNRVWQQLLGTGIVATTNNLGKLGATPTHPELLDVLAAELVDSGWSTKTVLRQIIRSQTYQRSSQISGDARERDPENKLLSHASRRRLTAEQLRDAMLLVSGSLDPTLGGPSVDCFISPHATANKKSNIPLSGPLDGRNRRSIYLKVRTNFYDPFLASFDFPDRSKSVGQRNTTIVPAQALALMNAPFVHEMSRRWGTRLAASHAAELDRLESAYRMALGYAPDREQVQIVQAMLQGMRQDPSITDPEAWRNLAHVIFNHPEFLWLD